jgi:pimeloyl-ACP methyl ester carboxylesterase
MSAEFDVLRDDERAGPTGVAHKRGRKTGIVLACFCASIAACADTRLSAPNGANAPIAISEYIETGGARLYFETRGDNMDAPLLLWLHGGPGGAERPLFRYFNSDLERRFLVVYYDQRGAGRSFDPEAPTTSLTIAQHVADLDTLIEHLRSRYGRDHVLLVGHSWGAVLGMLYAKAYPAKISGLVAVAPVVSFSEQQRREYSYDLAEATRRSDEDALRDLRGIGPPPYQTPSAMIQLQRVTERYHGVEFQSRSHAAIVVEGIFKGLVTPWELFRIVRANHRSLEVMHKELLAFDMRREVDMLQTPVFVFLGRHDRHVDANLAAEYFQGLRAPMKEIVWFEHSAHDIPFDEPRLFDERIVKAARRLGLLPDAR